MLKIDIQPPKALTVMQEALNFQKKGRYLLGGPPDDPDKDREWTFNPTVAGSNPVIWTARQYNREERICQEQK